MRRGGLSRSSPPSSPPGCPPRCAPHSFRRCAGSTSTPRVTWTTADRAPPERPPRHTSSFAPQGGGISMSHHAATAPDSSSLLSRLDESGFTNRHLTLYLTVLSGHFLCGFVINVTGVTLPGIVSSFHLTSAQAGVY